MKRTLSLLLSVIMLLGLASAVVLGGEAKEPNAVAVRTADEFLSMKPDGSYYLDADITLTESYADSFTGRFDGRGLTVTITNGAMFNKVENAEILNFKVKGDILATAKGYSHDGGDFAAAVVNLANGASSFSNIVSNVNFTTTSTDTRYGSIVATSAADYNLTFENCINNGDISVVKYAGGIYGWNAKVGVIKFKGCMNTGKLTAGGYCGGILARSSAQSAGIHITLESCINKGDIISEKEYGGGILGYADTYIRASRCLNFGNITAKAGHAAGILSNVGNPGSNDAIHYIEYNVNYGNITTESSSKYAAGIVGYVYGKASAYANVNGNINLGIIEGPGFCSQIIAYTNSNMTRIINNIGAGQVVGADRNRALMVGLSSANIAKYEISGNYFVENDGTMSYSYANDDKYASNRVALDARPLGSIVFVPEEQFKNGEVAETVNIALAATTFEVRDGRIALICRHEYPVLDGQCAACGAEIKWALEDTEPVDTTDEAPTDTTLPEDSTDTTEPVANEKSCAGLGAVVTLTALFATAALAVIKRKY